MPRPKAPLFLLFLFLASLSGCASFKETDAANWPPELPARSIFVVSYAAGIENREYQSLDEYLEWIRAFYEGTSLYPSGWNDLTDAVLARITREEQRARLQQQLFSLGRDIACEWAKANEVRRLNSGNLAVWGAATQRASQEASLADTLATIRLDVDALLSGELTADEITADRYHPPDPDDFFAF